MSAVAERVHVIPRRPVSKGSPRFLGHAAMHLLRPLPYAVGAYVSRAYQRRLAALLAAESFDVVVCDFLPPAANLPARMPCPTVLFTHNVEAEIWRRHYETTTSWWKRGLMKQQWHRMLRFERDAARRFDLVLAVSDTDRETVQRLYGPLDSPVRVVPTGVDTSFFAPISGEPRRPHIVFTGSMDWLPNEDGMLFFVREVLPLIRQKESAATLSIVGRAPTPAVRQLAAEPGVTVTGRVDDVRPYMDDAAVYIVPLRIGGGTRLKIFEAMSMAKAVVSTTVGAEGLPVTSGRDVMIADEPARFAQAVVHLIRDQDLRRRIESAARELVVAKYDWAAVAEDFESALVAVRPAPAAARLTA
jgi:glycosyltransferase involved in cell wall biosynthesis